MAKEPSLGGTTDAAAGGRKVQVNWDDRNVATVYANVVDGFASKEEITLMLGTQRPRRVGPGGLNVTISHQIVLTPSTAKRLLAVLAGVVGGYEKAHGEIPLPQHPPEATAPAPNR